MMKNILKLLLFFTPILAIMAAVNLVVDPAKIFVSDSYYDTIVGHFSDKKNIAGLSNCDDRILQKKCIQHFPAREVVIFGSSKTMEVDSVMANTSSFFNNGVSRATLPDMMALYWLYRKQNKVPRTIYIGIDPSFLNANNEEKRYMSYFHDYKACMTFLGYTLPLKEYMDYLKNLKIMQLFSATYFQASIQAFAENRGHLPKQDYTVTTRFTEDTQVKHCDGSISYGKKYREMTQSDVDKDAANPLLIEFSRFSAIDPAMQQQFESLLKLMQKDGVTVVFLLPPYHPATYKLISSDPKYAVILPVMSYFHDVANRLNIPFIGGIDPEPLGFHPQDFYDGKHVKRAPLAKWLSPVH